MQLNKKTAAILFLAILVIQPLFAQGPPPPPAVPLDGGLSALVALVAAGVIKLLKDRKKD